MLPKLEVLAATLKAARLSKGLSQRALALKISVPQSHISKIENAGVDLQTTSLQEIARALDLELVLVPRRLLPTLRALESNGNEGAPDETTLQRGFVELQKSLQRIFAIRPRDKILDQMQHSLNDLRYLRIPTQLSGHIRLLTAKIGIILDRMASEPAHLAGNTEIMRTLADQMQELRTLRNSIAHGMIDRPSEPVRAYQLDAEDA